MTTRHNGVSQLDEEQLDALLRRNQYAAEGPYPERVSHVMDLRCLMCGEPAQAPLVSLYAADRKREGALRRKCSHQQRGLRRRKPDPGARLNHEETVALADLIGNHQAPLGTVLGNALAKLRRLADVPPARGRRRRA